MIFCAFCRDEEDNLLEHKATIAAPRLPGGDADGTLEFIGVCDEHFATWYEETPDGCEIPHFEITEEQHRAMIEVRKVM